MRAVSLSDPFVKKQLDENFVCTWTDVSNDPAVGSSYKHSCKDQTADMARGLGEHNTQTLILTPDGRLLSALAGYLGPEDLREELEFAASLCQKVRQEPESNRTKVVESAHADFAEKLSQRKGREGLVGMEERFFSKTMTVGNQRGVADHEFSAKHALMP